MGFYDKLKDETKREIEKAAFEAYLEQYKFVMNYKTPDMLDFDELISTAKDSLYIDFINLFYKVDKAATSALSMQHDINKGTYLAKIERSIRESQAEMELQKVIEEAAAQLVDAINTYNNEISYSNCNTNEIIKRVLASMSLSNHNDK